MLPEALFEKLNGSLSIDRDRLRFAEYKVRVLEEDCVWYASRSTGLARSSEKKGAERKLAQFRNSLKMQNGEVKESVRKVIHAGRIKPLIILAPWQN